VIAASAAIEKDADATESGVHDGPSCQR